jgi:hypothetical protein
MKMPKRSKQASRGRPLRGRIEQFGRERSGSLLDELGIVVAAHAHHPHIVGYNIGRDTGGPASCGIYDPDLAGTGTAVLLDLAEPTPGTPRHEPLGQEPSWR